MNETYIELDTHEGPTFKRKFTKFSIYARY